MKTYKQPEVGFEGYEKGAEILFDFFKMELEKFRKPELSDIGKKIVEVSLDNGGAEDYKKLL